MEREDLLSAVVFAFGGAAVLATGFVRAPAPDFAAPFHAEARAWRRIWGPIVPGVVVVSALFGWWLQEPDTTPDDVALPLLIVATLMSAIWGRALFRASVSLLRARRLRGPALTVGVVRPTVVVDDAFARSLAPGVARAVRMHEEAHRRHHDPRRLWLAQLATDLQWPWPQAHARFRAWRFALELARDEEACCAGASRTDLAEAVLEAAKQTPRYLAPAPALGDDAAEIETRVRWLLERDDAPSLAISSTSHRRVVVAVVAAALAVAAMAFLLGDAFLRALPGVTVFGE